MAKKFMDKGGGGTSRFSVEKCVSHSAEIFRLRGESIIVAIILSKEKVSIRGGGGYQDFQSKNVCLTVP